MARDAEDTRRRLLAAAADEFAQRGIAGARVDRIAAAAGANKALIYAYFGNKDQLFDAVFDALVVSTVAEVPIDADDLPGYAGRLFDRNQTHPQALRLLLWHSLERGGMAALPQAVTASNADKAAAIAAAQRSGQLPGRYSADELLLLVVGLSLLGSAELAPVDGPEALARRRHMVTDAVARLVTHDGNRPPAGDDHPTGRGAAAGSQESAGRTGADR
ncbi:TetR family transcriptional regulator [Micromonospora soli]|uniref:TetR family transcriptional regulator n=1 Tax=Micromonospora sp. NBRC 110009 TaxID=3061627 RepID=UPI0026725947|nr:TetR family transcriptional regulator [Micromonospora sp. NBRC 110009]WKT96600.1 TetR family transcriptional regulator [Micromonospora sp. NBRC 110009]